MTQTVVMPKLGQTVEEATLVKWHKKPGDPIKKGDVLFEIETDKAVLEVESFYEGILLKIITREGETVPVMSAVAFIGNEGDPIPDVVPRPTASKKTTAPASPIEPSKATPASSEPVETRPQPAATIQHVGRKAVSPRARALARDCAVSTDPITGSGPGGRVIEKDVRDYLVARGYHSLRINPAAKDLARAEGIDVLEIDSRGERITVEAVRRAIAEKPVPMPRLRRVIAERLTQSYLTAPHFFVTQSVDMTELLSLRRDLKKQQQPYSLTDFMLKAVALALTKFPALNSSTDGKSVRWHSRVYLGMAVAVKDGLIVPVIRDADQISLKDLHQAAISLALKAREGALEPDEMTGSTFTVSNMGMLNVENFTAIINPGESAILAVSSTVQKPVVIKGELAVRSMMKMTLSSDHRLVDGATAAGFINAVKKNIEDIEQWKNMISQS